MDLSYLRENCSEVADSSSYSNSTGQKEFPPIVDHGGPQFLYSFGHRVRPVFDVFSSWHQRGSSVQAPQLKVQKLLIVDLIQIKRLNLFIKAAS